MCETLNLDEVVRSHIIYVLLWFRIQLVCFANSQFEQHNRIVAGARVGGGGGAGERGIFASHMYNTRGEPPVQLNV